MAWKQFPYPDAAYVYTPQTLEAAWARLHAGDVEPFPTHPALVQAWLAFHAGDFERAVKLGLAVGVPGYAVAHKATCIYATHLEVEDRQKLDMYEEVAERCERQQSEQPDNPAGYYWHAYSLGRCALGTSVVKALAHSEYARALSMLDGKKKLAEALALYEKAAECVALDAKERLEVEAAIDELKG